MAEPEAGADANQGYGYSPYGHSGHGYGHLPYGHPLSRREAEAEAEAEPEADPALLYGGYYGYGLGYYGGYRGYYSHPYAVAAGVPYANGWTDGPNNGVGYGYHYLGKREAEAEPEAEEVEAVVRVNNFQKVSFVYHFYQRIWTEILHDYSNLKILSLQPWISKVLSITWSI